MRVKREDLLGQLESVKPGLSPKEIIEQSSCFVFSDGNVCTYNGEIACRHETDLKITGAVQAGPLLQLLHRLDVDTLDLNVDGGELLITKGSHSSGIRMEENILLPFDKVETPKKWNKLPDDFSDAVETVAYCAGKDESKYTTTCIHVHPEYIEAFDNYQLAKYRLDTGVTEECLVRAEAMNHILNLSVTQVAETRNWIHFKNGNGLVLSSLRSFEDYFDLSKMFKVKEGTAMNLPKGIGEAADKAQIFSQEDKDNNQVKVTITPKNGGKMWIKGMGASGWYKKVLRVSYSGEPVKFLIAPHLLIKLIERYNDCHITSNRLMVKGGKFKYVACLGAADEK